MKPSALARFFAFALALFALAAPPMRAADSYRSYANARFGYVVEYPSNLLSPRPDPYNSDGRRFVSRDGKIVLRVYAGYNLFNYTLAQQQNFVLKNSKAAKARVTYSRAGPQWFAVSGFIGGDIFYQKTVLWKGAFHTMIWRYPASQRKRMDAPVTRTTRSFAAENFAVPVVSSPPKAAPAKIAAPEKVTPVKGY